MGCNVITLLLGASLLAATPTDSVLVSLADARTQPFPISYRYLSLHNIPRESRLDYKHAVDFVLNSLSKTGSIKHSVALDNMLVLRFDLSNYEIDDENWNKLIEKGSGRTPLPEPYFHKELDGVVYWPGGKENGTYYAPGYYKFGSKKVLAPAQWLNTIAISKLINLTQSKHPIVRADWFISFALWAPAYYDLLGVGSRKEKDFEELFALDTKRASRSVIKGVTDTRIVTLNNRVLVRFPTVNTYFGAYYWKSIDTDKGFDDADYLANLVDPQFTGAELIASLLNGLQGYGVANNKGQLVDSVPANIAADKTSRFQDTQVYGARNCITCHDQGLRKIDDRVRKLSQKDIALFVTEVVKDKKLADSVLSAFYPDLGVVLTHDISIYANAVKQVNGLTPSDNAALFERICHDYLEEFITPEVAAQESGYTVENMLAKLKVYKNLDHSLVSFIQEPPLPVSRLHWERRGFAQLMEILTSE